LFSWAVGVLKDKSAIHIAWVYDAKRENVLEQHFLARAYFVFMVDMDRKWFREYISVQEKEDRQPHQMNLFQD